MKILTLGLRFTVLMSLMALGGNGVWADDRGVSPPETVTISHVGDPGTSFTVSSIALDDDTHFTLVGGGTCAAVPFVLSQGESCTQLVVFDPQAVGPLTTNLVVSSDAGAVINDTVVLTGEGTPGPQAQLTIVPDPMDFGLVAPGGLPVTDVFTVSNTGDPGTSFDITNLALSGATQFSILSQNCNGTTLNDGDSCTITIEFDSVTDGLFNGQLEVQTTIGSGTAAIQGSTQIPAQLAFVIQPSDVVVNQSIAPAVVVEVQDSSGALVALDNGTIIQLAIDNDPSGSASLGGIVSATVSGGQASFANLSINQVGNGFTLIASDSLATLTTDTSTAFNVLPGAPASLEIIAQPSDAVVGQAIAPPVLVRVLDAFGFTVTTDNTTAVSLALSGGTPGALLSGGGPSTVAGGIATFPGLSVDQVGTAYLLTPSGAPGGLGGPASTPFDITSAGSGTTFLSVNPAGSQVVGQPYTVTVQVTGFNPTGTVTVTDGSGASCDIILPATSCDLTSTTAGPRTLTANYPGDANNGSSNDIQAYTITQASTTVSIDSISPAGQQSVNTAYTVNVSVSGGFNPTGVITVDDGAGASCPIVLPATSCDLASTSVGPKTITATYPGDSNNTGDSDTAPYLIVAGAPAGISFVIQPPATGVAGQALSTTPQLQVLDAFGNPVLSDNSTSISLALIGGNPAANLSGLTTQTVTNGVADFPGLSVDLVGSDYQLQASAAGLSGDTSTTFLIGPGPAATLQFDVEPTSTLVNTAITPAVVVSVRDAFGNLVTTDNSTVVTLALLGPFGANLLNYSPMTVVGGLATFTGLAIDQAGVGYALRAEDSLSSLPQVDSASFNVTESASITSIVSITPAGSQTVGLSYEVQVNVTGDTPTGLVTIDDGQGASCSFNWPSDDRCDLTSLQAGPVTITASYAGDVNNASSSDTAPYDIDPAASTTSITSLVPSGQQTVGVAYTVNVTVSGFNPTGTVDVNDGAGTSCLITLPQTSCVLTSTVVGPKTISANYSGDANNQTSAMAANTA
ncbi:MAG: Ig-like domain repeat protein [Pseudomonadota bacterium]